MYLTNPIGKAKKIDISGIDEDSIKAVAAATQGYSGREISKLAIAWQAAAYGTENSTLTSDIFLRVLQESKDSKSQKMGWLSPEEIENRVKDAEE